MPKTFTVRPAALSDSEGIARVHTRSWQSAYRGLLPDEWLDGLKWQDRKERWDRGLRAGSPTTIYVATNPQKEIVGFASMGPTRDEDLEPDEFFELYAIYLLPDIWNLGVGSKLLLTIARQIPSNFHWLSVWVLRDNIQGRSFYETRGFTADGAAKMAEIGSNQCEEVRYRIALPLNRDH